ncbi:UDP-glycosyltransferase 72B1 [Selaginella moellendorffii]|uniref:UDP-glycosyltransferase 72B1 n=1 Tax=Selaginella moellendorffii TaxID=88036 RepID=UPI000D1CBBC1|nr:UDP-glycosyltransferase 72B1 [Selaginella moellendorffii]XP_024517264.1 UDP-glycosyltransferase 72B1 [Selaginella moellendorffii]|eukprot:XP_024517211.1 UDP-glycosyltransferase 72B1 [Selaginella moellendorffii]
MENAEKIATRHVLLLTCNGIGHINPALTLATKLASMGLSITLVVPDAASFSLVASTDFQGLPITLTKLPLQDHGQEEQHQQGWTMEGLRVAVRSGYEWPSDYSRQKIALAALLEELKVSSSSPCCVIVDMILNWSEELLVKTGLPRFILYPAAPNYLALSLHARSLYRKKLLPVKFPGFETMKVEGLLPLYRRDVPDAMTDDGHCLYPLHMGFNEHIISSDGILFNSFTELEPELFKALAESFEEIKHHELLPIGPLFPSKYFTPDALNATKESSVLRSSEEERCQSWLDEQPVESVLYVSFGSWALLTPRQICELALGLEASQQRFLWVVPVENKSIEELEALLPEGFLKRTEERGLVLPGWAPQHLILAHSSLGGFLTHCGWNSTLEVITLAGVPVIGWPFLADQPPICRYLVDGLGIGAEVLGDDDGFVDRDEVERGVREIMESPRAEGMKSRAKELQAKARRAVAQGGSSQKNLEAFVARIKSLLV